MKEIRLTKGQCTIVDDEDFEYLNQFKWTAQKRTHKHGVVYYAFRSEGKKYISMANRILNNKTKCFIDHIDNNPLNNQKSNLRLCNRSQNGINRLGWGKVKYKGVTIDKKGKYSYFRARIMVDKKTYNIGTFSSEIDAAIAYNVAAKKHFGEFAKLNHI